MRQRVVRVLGGVYRLAVLLLALVLGPTVSAGAQGTGGVIRGTISDAQGLALPGVTMTVTNTETGAARTIVSEGDGQYRLAGLPPGRYVLKAELQGFAPVEVKDLTLTIGLEIARDITLALQGLEESVTVTGQAPVVETTRTEVAAVVTQTQIDSLPFANRQPITLALVLPGTSMDQTSGRRSQANIGAGGATNQMNAYHVDGGMNWSNNSGQQHLEVPQSAIREFKVNISQSTAEYGGNLAGVVISVTKSGTNRFSGEAFEYFRNKSLNAMDKFQEEAQKTRGTPKPDYRRDQYGVALGGPIVKDRLHFFLAAERPTVERNFTVSTGQPQFYSALEGTFPTDYERRMYFARGDLQINEQQSLFVRYSYDLEIIGCETCGGSNAANAGPRVRSPRDSNLVGHTWVLGTRALNEIRAQIPPSHLNHRQAPTGIPLWDPSRKWEFPPERFEPYQPVYVFPSLTWGAEGWSMNWTDRLELRDDLSYTFGSHTMKVGGAYIRLFSPEEQSANLRGTWTFGTDQFFDGTAAAMANLTSPIQFTASFPPLPRHLRNHWIQGYVQNEWRVRSNLTVDFGLRYDNQYKSFNTHLDLSPVPRLTELIDPASRGDNNNIGPRAGFAWDLKDDGRSVLRGAYGRYYQYVMQGSLRPELTALRQTSIVIRNPSYPDPYGGRSPEAFASTAPPNISILDDNLRNPSADAVSLGFSQELKANLAVHVDGIYTDTRDMPRTTNINTPPDPVTGQRPLPSWGRIVQLQSLGEHQYRALFVRLDKRYSNRHQYLLSYTLAKQKNNGATAYVTDFYNPGLDWGPASADRRHAFVASGSMLLPHDVTLGAVWTLRSTMPFSARAGLDLNRDGNTSADYVPGTTRNQGNRGNMAEFLTLVNAWRAANRRAPISADQIETNGQSRLDVRVSKAFAVGGTRKVELIAQVFNLLGSDILVGIGQAAWQENALSASFGQIRTVQPRQEAELAVRFVW